MKLTIFYVITAQKACHPYFVRLFKKMESRILCILANSVKNQQSCIAGIEISKNTEGKWQNLRRWIRPISHRTNGAISDQESFLVKTGKVPQLFDIVEIPLQKPAYVEGQPEDWLIDPSVSWKHHGHFDPQKSVSAFLENPVNLWLQKDEKPDRVTPEWVAKHDLPSLYFVKPDHLKIYVQETDYRNGPKRSRRAAFHYLGEDYDFGMTDPATSSKHFPDYWTRPSGIHAGIDLECAAICVSLAPAWKGEYTSQAYHYKLVAGIIENA